MTRPTKADAKAAAKNDSNVRVDFWLLLTPTGVLAAIAWDKHVTRDKASILKLLRPDFGANYDLSKALKFWAVYCDPALAYAANRHPESLTKVPCLFL